jgi:hypothetical protein
MKEWQWLVPVCYAPETVVTTEVVLTAGVHHWYLTQVLLKIRPPWHHRANDTLPCPYNDVCWIHMKEWQWLVPVCYAPGTVIGHRSCADCCWGPSLIFNPSFAQNQTHMTPQSQWNSSLTIQWCLLDPYGRMRVVGSCLLCPWDCQWPQKLCWMQLGSITDFQFCSKSDLHDTTETMKLFLDHTMMFVGSIWKNESGWFLFVMPLGLSVTTDVVLTAGEHRWFSTQVLLKIRPAWHHRANKTLPRPWNGVFWIHMEEWEWLVPVCYAPGAVSGGGVTSHWPRSMYPGTNWVYRAGGWSLASPVLWPKKGTFHVLSWRLVLVPMILTVIFGGKSTFVPGDSSRFLSFLFWLVIVPSHWAWPIFFYLGTSEFDGWHAVYYRCCADCWGTSLIFNPGFAQNQTRMTPQSQWNSPSPIQWCLLDPYGRMRVVGSCLLCPWGCLQWPQKFCRLLGSVTDFQPRFCSKSDLLDTTEPIKLFLAHKMVIVGSIWKNDSGWFLFVMPLGLSLATEVVLAAGVHHWFLTQILLKIRPAWHHKANETLPWPYDDVC